MTAGLVRVLRPPPTIPQELPPGLTTWTLTDHAKEQAEARLFSLTEVLVTAELPETVLAGRNERAAKVRHMRGDCIAVVDPYERVVVTVADGNHLLPEDYPYSRLGRAEQERQDIKDEKTIRVTSEMKLKALTARILHGADRGHDKKSRGTTVSSGSDLAQDRGAAQAEVQAKHVGEADHRQQPRHVLSRRQSTGGTRSGGPDTHDRNAALRQIQAEGGGVAMARLTVESRVTHTVEAITPALARLYYETTPKHNRKIRPVKVDAMSHDILHDAWEDNGEAIIFDEEGRLIDGQHRMLAIEKAGVVVKMHVMRGVKASAIHTIDTGMPRRYSDVLHLQGIVQKERMGAAALHRRIYFWRQGRRCMRIVREQVTNAELLALEEEFRLEFALALERALPVKKKGILSLATGATAFFILAERNLEKAQEFFDLLEAGVGGGLTVGHPIYELRERLRSAKSERLNEDEKLALTFKAWNLWRDGLFVRNIQLNRNALTDKTMPEPK